jgi:hypothetical protein
MAFVNFSLIFGSALVAVPIVLHLIMRQKPQRLEFPALRFIQKRHESNRRRLRLRHLLLLLLRAGAIALMAFALARPSLQMGGSLGSQEAPVAAALVFDTAPRMDYKSENQTRLDAARKTGLWLLGQLPYESQVAVVDARPASGVGLGELAAARERVQKLETAVQSQPLVSAVERAVQIVGQSDLARKEVYIFTDLSRSAWPRDKAAELQSRILDAAGTAIYVIDVGAENPVNVSLGEVRLSAQVLSARSSLTIESELSSVGGAEGEKRTVELYLLDGNGQPQKRGEQTHALRADRGQQIEFRVASLEVGTHQGYLQLLGQDGLGCDDKRYFSVVVKPPWRILVAAPKPVARYALFLTQALAPSEARKRGQARFDCDAIELTELAEKTLDDYSAVCLLDPTPLEPAAWQKLRDYAMGGRSVAIFLGRNAKAEAFNEPAPQQLLPGKLLRQARWPDGDCYLAPRDYQHAILAPFRGRAGAIPWDAHPVFYAWQLDKLAEGTSTIVHLNQDYRPVLLERALGAGRVLTMTTPVSDQPNDKAWNLLPVALHGGKPWPFVMLVNQIASYLVGSSEQQLNYLAAEPVVLLLDPQNRRDAYLVTGPGETSFTVSAKPDEHQLDITAPDQVGNFRVQSSGGAEGVDMGFSVNLSPDQTDLRRIGEDELAEAFGPLKYRVARTREQIDRDINTGRVGRELFTPLILLLALVLLGEHVLANRFYKEGGGRKGEG